MFTMKGDSYVYSSSHAVYYIFIVTEKIIIHVYSDF